MAVSVKQKFRFGPFVLDVHSGELYKHDFKLKVQPQPIQVLAVLLEHPGELVTRDELQKRIWPSDTFVDFEHGLNTAVKKLRQALGDESDTPKYIETLPRRGYRFIGKSIHAPERDVPLAISEGQTLKHEESVVSHQKTPLRFDRTRSWTFDATPPFRTYSVALALLMALAVSAFVVAYSSGKIVKDSSDSSFRAHSSIAQDSYTQGQSLLERYDRPGNLDAAITSFNSAVHADPEFALGYAALGEAYWYRYVLSRDPSSLEQAEGFSKRSVAMNDQLPDVHITLGRIEAERNQRDLALQEMQVALRLDPHNAKAMLGFGAIYAQLDRLDEAEQSYQKAVKLNPDSWIGHNDLGNLYYDRRKYDLAAQQFQNAAEITPDNPIVHSNYALALQELGDMQRAESEFKRSIELEPSYRGFTNLGRLYYTQGRWKEAAESIERALPFNNSDYRLWANLALAYDWLDDKNKADKAFKKELELLLRTFDLKHEDPEVICELGVLYARQHDSARAIPLLEKALALRPNVPTILHNAAEGFEHLGDRTRAFDLLQRALELGLPHEKIEHNPGMRNLCRDRRYLALNFHGSPKAQQ